MIQSRSIDREKVCPGIRGTFNHCLIVYLVFACVLALTGCPATRSPIQRAIFFLEGSQTKHDSNVSGHVDYAGNWPQVFHFKNVPGYRIPDVSPFVVVFAHHALATITPETQIALGLGDADIFNAQDMRRRAKNCLLRFQSDENAHDAGTFGFWPYDADPRPGDSPLELALFDLLQGPLLGGDRTPANLSYFPSELAVPMDADVTATVYAALFDDQLLDGGQGVETDLGSRFGSNRHTNDVLLRFAPNWLPDESGAYLTWFMRKRNGAIYGNDIDLVVNANVLFVLARYGLTATPGFANAIALINDAVNDGLHRRSWDDISLYYPDNYVFHYGVSRAFAEGPIPSLGPAMQRLASELLDEAHRCRDGAAYWDKGHPHLNTAFAVLTLLNAGTNSPLVDEGIAYLERAQNPATGAWAEAPFFIARADSGIVIEWESAPLTTAIALEALCKAQLRNRRHSNSSVEVPE